MTRSKKDILTKGIKQAIENGWKYKGFNIIKSKILPNKVILIDFDESWFVPADEYNEEKIEPYNTRAFSINDLIYDHDFAKALWGEKEDYLDVEVINPEIGGHYDTQEQPPLAAYKKHLAQMVIADDPIKYLGEHI